MKKNTFFAVIGILICVLTTSQAYAYYEIVWWGDESGSTFTTEASRTEQASIELFNKLPIFPEAAPSPEGTCFDGMYEPCAFEVPDNCVGLYYAEYTARAAGYYLVCESGNWIHNHYGSNFGGPFVEEGSWDVVWADADNDGIVDNIDNCPNVANPNQEDVDIDGTGDACDSCPNDENNDADSDGVCGDIDNCPNNANPNQQDTDTDSIADACDDDTIYGTISGDVQEGINVNIYILSCGVPQPHATVITDAQGYYAIGDVPNGRYLVGPDNASYTFSNSKWVDIPLAEIKPYNFTATVYTCDDVDRFLDNSIGTVKDCRTGLIWLKNANCFGTQNWDTAMAFAAGLNRGECGLTDLSVEGDWRLPTKDELQGIGTDPPTTWDYGSPSVTWTIPGSPFVNVNSGRYWSSTKYRYSDGSIAVNYPESVIFDDGYSSNAHKSYGLFVLPVRDAN